ncbi:MAG: hypothetical protein Q9157_002368 [Trypethelium eluteriae]
MTESPQASVQQSSERGSPRHMEQFERERSISVSPKTRVPSQSQMMDERRSGSHDQLGHHIRQSQYDHYNDKRGLSAGGISQTPLATGVSVRSQTDSGAGARSAQTPLSHLNAPINGEGGFLSDSIQHDYQKPIQLDSAHSNQLPSTTNSFGSQPAEMGTEKYELSTGSIAPRLNSDSEHTMTYSSVTPTEPMHIRDPNGNQAQSEIQQAESAPALHEPAHGSESQFQAGIKSEPNPAANFLQPSHKRTRYNEPPIWARRSHITAHIRGQRSAQGPKQERSNTRLQSRSVTPMVAKSPANGEINGVRPQAAGLDFEETNDGPLGYWERSITSVEPYNDLTRIVTDFIYSELGQWPETAVSDVGGNVSPNGQIEIEAKLGTLVDKGSNERIRLPVVSAVILDLEARKQIAFESFMTEHQHKALNDFLNAEVQKSHARPSPGQRPRVKIHYEHKRERDSFHELTQAGFHTLPAPARHIIESQGLLKRTKVRITKDQKSGRESARIVKCRLVDLDIYCPREAFDVRISINLEIAYQGEIEESTKVKFPDRVKDRLSYLHQAYQVDLTQVTDGGGSGGKTHELEVEISSAEVRRQMKLLQEGKENELERLIKVFLDNVKVLSRAVPPVG